MSIIGRERRSIRFGFSIQSVVISLLEFSREALGRVGLLAAVNSRGGGWLRSKLKLKFSKKYRSPTLVVNGSHVMGTQSCTIHTCLLYGPADHYDDTRSLCVRYAYYVHSHRGFVVVSVAWSGPVYPGGEGGDREDLNRVAESRTTGGRRRDTTRKRLGYLPPVLKQTL